jgi:hypothetical protein
MFANYTGPALVDKTHGARPWKIAHEKYLIRLSTKTKKGALLFPLFENESAFGPGEVLAIRLEGLQIDDATADDATALGELIKIASLKCPQLKTLLLTNNALSTTQIFTTLVTLLKEVDVRELTLDGPDIKVDPTMRKSIINAWNMRSLELTAE